MADENPLWGLTQQYLVNPARQTAQSIYDIGTSPVRSLGDPRVQSFLFGTPPTQGTPHPGALDFTPLLGIAPFIRGAGGFGANSTIPRAMPPRFKPQQVEGVLEDIGRGRREMIAGKRVAGDDVIANVEQFGLPTIQQMKGPRDLIYERLDQLRNAALPSRGSVEDVARTRERSSLYDTLEGFHKNDIARRRAEGAATQSVGGTETPIPTNAITERGLINSILQDALKSLLGAKVPHQQYLVGEHSLTPEQIRQIRPQEAPPSMHAFTEARQRLLEEYGPLSNRERGQR